MPILSRIKLSAEQQDLLILHLAATVVSVLVSIVIIAFREMIDGGQSLFLSQPGAYEALSWWLQASLLIFSALFLGALFDYKLKAWSGVGVFLVYRYFKGLTPMPWQNALVQFFAGSFMITCGHSVDREGPGVHLGTAVGHFFSRFKNFDKQEKTTLINAGIASSIAVAFNTPLAAVIFAVEVFHIRYAVNRFMPVMLATILATLVSRFYFGEHSVFLLNDVQIAPTRQMSHFLFLGIICGTASLAFILVVEKLAPFFMQMSYRKSFFIAACFTALISSEYPQVMGISYDTLDAMLKHPFGLSFLIGLIFAKLLATAVSVACRIPGGLIGPALIIGGACGAAYFQLISQYWETSASFGFYVLIGMLTTMAAVLNAPLTALLALLEMTNMTEILLPGLLSIFAADLINRLFFKRTSVFSSISQLIPQDQEKTK